MTPEETPVPDVLTAAAGTIGEMPREAVQSKFAQLQQMRKALTEREIIRQQTETDSIEGDEAAYQAGLMHEKSDPKQAARWYRVAAENDFPEASLKLAKVLAALAVEHRAKGEDQAAEALIEEASDWWVKACAAGEFAEGEAEDFDLLEELNARLELARREAESGSGGPEGSQCVHGGLAKAMAMLPNQKAVEAHLNACGSCLAEKGRAAKGASAPAAR
jgi:hypothetical protein